MTLTDARVTDPVADAAARLETARKEAIEAQGGYSAAQKALADMERVFAHERATPKWIVGQKQAQDRVLATAQLVEQTQATFIEAEKAHHQAQVDEWEAARPDLLRERHRLARKADEQIAVLNQTLEGINSLNAKIHAINVDEGPSVFPRQTKLVQAWLVRNLGAARLRTDTRLLGPISGLGPYAQRLADLYHPDEQPEDQADSETPNE